MKIEDFIKRADELIAQADSVLQTSHGDRFHTFVDGGLFHGFRSAALSFLAATFGEKHVYFREFDTYVKNARPEKVEQGKNILLSAQQEMSGGWTTTVKGLVSAEIFSDFLEMASYLLGQGYKDPAAVMIGSVLEEHLRQLCQKNRIKTEVLKQGKPVPKKADLLNAELVKAGVYDKLDQKNITAWLHLRNNAAHGKYDEYTKEQVSLMEQGVTDFMARVRV